VAAIGAISPPSSKVELQTVLGMMTYLSKFTHNLSNITSPMLKLLHKMHNLHSIGYTKKGGGGAFEEVKSILTACLGPILRYFDPSKPMVLQVDASKHGFSVLLIQEGRPIAYSSKSLTPSKCDYAQIEKELFAIVL
jgi:hypothetical protein